MPADSPYATPQGTPAAIAVIPYGWFTGLTGSGTYTIRLLDSIASSVPSPEARMPRQLAVAISAALVVPIAVHAQVFKVAKYNIGGEGGTDYVTAEAGTGRVFVSRTTHVMVVDGTTGKVLADIPDTPRMHGVGIAAKHNHGFTTNAGDSTVMMFDLKTLAVLKKIAVKAGGLDGIMYDDYSDRIILTNHSRPIGTAVALDANTGEIVGTAELEDIAPEGAASDGQGKLFVNNEEKNTIQVLDAKSMKVLASWPLAPCEGPTGIAYDRATNRIFSGCGKTSVVVDAKSGKVVATIANGDGVDALGWDPAQKLIYIPAGRDGNVTVVHQDSPDKYSIVATVQTMPGAKTITVDPVTHNAYLFQPEYGPAPAGAAPGPGGRPARGPVVAGWFFTITH
jgi:DNA-binding beta-propeller fold protein YncE